MKDRKPLVTGDKPIDSERGIYRKFEIKRTDGSSEKGGKHERCAYFVLDLEHDEFAMAALGAYAEACEKKYPELAKDLVRIIREDEPDCGCREAVCPHTPPWPLTSNDVAHKLMGRKNRTASRKRLKRRA